MHKNEAFVMSASGCGCLSLQLLLFFPSSSHRSPAPRLAPRLAALKASDLQPLIHELPPPKSCSSSGEILTPPPASLYLIILSLSTSCLDLLLSLSLSHTHSPDSLFFFFHTLSSPPAFSGCLSPLVLVVFLTHRVLLLSSFSSLPPPRMCSHYPSSPLSLFLDFHSKTFQQHYKFLLHLRARAFDVCACRPLPRRSCRLLLQTQKDYRDYSKRPEQDYSPCDSSPVEDNLLTGGVAVDLLVCVQSQSAAICHC